jgi:EAL and modified HD-GYP domain-containing signal transduction protein
MEQPLTRELFLGRQPILDRDQNLAAFELLFRSGHYNGARVEDDVFASATVINHAFSELGVEAVLGKYPGFINLSAPLIMSEVIELLPKDRVVLEILEHVRITDPLVQRCKSLKAMGFTLALDDFTGREDEYRPLLEVVDIVKVDIQGMDDATLARTTAALKELKVKLLAEKVDTREQADRCIGLGYELFQGYYFARPSVITGKRLTDADAALVQLLQVVLNNDDAAGADAVLRDHPQLATSLSRLAREVTAGDSVSGPTVRRPRRWLPLLAYMLSSAPGAGFPSPLLILAATRGKLMELLARALRPSDRGFQERAFLTGALSLVNALLGLPMSEILSSIPLTPDVRSALQERGGEAGALLTLAEALEESDLQGIERALDHVHGLDHGQVIGLQVEAMRWANSIGDAG